MFNTIRDMAKEVQEAYKISHDLRIQKSIEKLNEKIVELDNKKYYNHTSVAIPSNESKVMVQDVKQDKIDYTYFTNSKKQHGIISIALKKFGVKVTYPQSKKGKKDYYLKVVDMNTNKFNQLMENNWQAVENYLHKSERKNTGRLRV